MKKYLIDQSIKILFGGVFLLFLVSCTITEERPRHSFLINGWFDGWASSAYLLEYSYGDEFPMTKNMVKPGSNGLGYSFGVTGPMPVGDFLYVKWRLKETGEIFDDRVDLRGRLAKNMEGFGVTFTIEGRQLYVYLVSPVPKHEGDPPLYKTTQSRHYVTYEIYPNNTYQR